MPRVRSMRRWAPHRRVLDRAADAREHLGEHGHDAVGRQAVALVAARGVDVGQVDRRAEAEAGGAAEELGVPDHRRDDRDAGALAEEAGAGGAAAHRAAPG